MQSMAASCSWRTQHRRSTATPDVFFRVYLFALFNPFVRTSSRVFSTDLRSLVNRLSIESPSTALCVYNYFFFFTPTLPYFFNSQIVSSIYWQFIVIFHVRLVKSGGDWYYRNFDLNILESNETAITILNLNIKHPSLIRRKFRKWGNRGNRYLLCSLNIRNISLFTYFYVSCIFFFTSHITRLYSLCTFHISYILHTPVHYVSSYTLSQP